MRKHRWNTSTTNNKRLTGRALQRAREDLFRRNPYCVHCLRRGIKRLSTQRDHIINLASGGIDDPDNTQGLCDDCHKLKTHEESHRARGITSKPRVNSGCDVNGYPISRDHHWNKQRG